MPVVTPWGFSPIHAPEPAHTCAEPNYKDAGSRQGLQYQRQTDRPHLNFRCSILISKSSRTITYTGQQQAYWRDTRCSITW